MRLEQSPRRIVTANAGLALLGEAIRVAQLEAAVASLGPYRGTGHAEVLTTYLGLLTLGKSDFEAAEGARSDPFFLAALGLERGISAARTLTPAPLLLRLDSGHDALENRVRAEIERIDFLIKWNPRQTDPAKVLAQAEALGAAVHWEHPRPGKRVGTFSVTETRSWQDKAYTHRRVTRVAERTIDRRGQALLVPELEIEGWWTSLDLPDATIIDLYRDHATSEQFHSEFKTDLDLERLPSGKFDANTLVLAAGTFVYNVLRWIGLTGLMGPGSPVRHPAKRRRVRTVMQELIALPAQFVRHARQLWLRFSAHCPGFAAFQHVRQRLQACASG